MTLDTTATTHVDQAVIVRSWDTTMGHGSYRSGSFVRFGEYATTTGTGVVKVASQKEIAEAKFKEEMEDAKRQVVAMLPFDKLLEHARNNKPSQEWYDEDFGR